MYKGGEHSHLSQHKHRQCFINITKHIEFSQNGDYNSVRGKAFDSTAVTTTMPRRDSITYPAVIMILRFAGGSMRIVKLTLDRALLDVICLRTV